MTTTSSHFVTTVSPHHKGKRLTFNGWWQSAWTPRLADDIEGLLAAPEKRAAITHTQVQAIADLVNDPWQNIPAERRQALTELKSGLIADLFPHGARAGISLTDDGEGL